MNRGGTRSHTVLTLDSHQDRAGPPALTLVEEREVLLDDREQGDDRRLQVLAAQDIAVLRHVSGRIKQVLEVLE